MKRSHAPGEHSSLDHADLRMIPSIVSFSEVHMQQTDSGISKDCLSQRNSNQSRGSFLPICGESHSDFAFVNSAFEHDSNGHLSQFALIRGWVSEQSMNTYCTDARMPCHRSSQRNRCHSDSLGNKPRGLLASQAGGLASQKNDANKDNTGLKDYSERFVTRASIPQHLRDKAAKIPSTTAASDTNKANDTIIQDGSYCDPSSIGRTMSVRNSNSLESNQVIITENLSPGGIYVNVGLAKDAVMVRETLCQPRSDCHIQLSEHGGEVTHLNGHLPTEISTTDAEPKETNGNDTLRELTEKDVAPSGKAFQPGCSKSATRRTSTKRNHYALENKDKGEAIDPKVEEFGKDGTYILQPQTTNIHTSSSGDQGTFCNYDMQIVPLDDMREVPLDDIDEILPGVKSIVSVTERRLRCQNTKGKQFSLNVLCSTKGYT